MITVQQGVLIYKHPDSGNYEVDIRGLSPDQAVEMLENFLKGYKENLPIQRERYQKEQEAKKK